MGSDTVIPEDYGVGGPLDSGLKIGALVDMIEQELQNRLWGVG